MSVDRRKQIVDAAAQSFALYGYKATTIDQVAKLANVGKGTIYTFFANKEELFDEIMNGVIQEVKLQADQAFEANAPFIDNLKRTMDRLVEYQDKHQLALKMAQEVRDIGTAKAKDGLHRLEQAILQYVQAKIEAGITRGDIRPCDPRLTAFVMLKLYAALASDWQQIEGNNPLDKAQVAELFQMYFMHGVAPIDESRGG